MCLARTVPISYCCPFLHSPFGVQRSALSGPKGLPERASASLMASDGVGWDGLTKVSFNFLHTLWIYRLCIYLLVLVIKVVTDILMGFKI